MSEREHEHEHEHEQPVQDRASSALSSAPARAMPPMRALAPAIGNQAFAAHVARQPMTASDQEEEIPAAITNVAENVIAAPLDAVADELSKGTPPGKWPALRARMARATAGFDHGHPADGGQRRQALARRQGQRVRRARADGRDDLPRRVQDLRMAWGRSYGTLSRSPTTPSPSAAAVREKAMAPVLEGINMIPSLEKEEDPAKILEIRQGTRGRARPVGGRRDDPLIFAGGAAVPPRPRDPADGDDVRGGEPGARVGLAGPRRLRRHAPRR